MTDAPKIEDIVEHTEEKKTEEVKATPVPAAKAEGNHLFSIHF